MHTKASLVQRLWELAAEGRFPTTIGALIDALALGQTGTERLPGMKDFRRKLKLLNRFQVPLFAPQLAPTDAMDPEPAEITARLINAVRDSRPLAGAPGSEGGRETKEEESEDVIVTRLASTPERLSTRLRKRPRLQEATSPPQGYADAQQMPADSGGVATGGTKGHFREVDEVSRFNVQWDDTSAFDTVDPMDPFSSPLTLVGDEVFSLPGMESPLVHTPWNDPFVGDYPGDEADAPP